MNITCKHKQIIKNDKEKIDFCRKCGCFIVIKYSDKQKEVESYSILPKKMITPLEISPYDSIDVIIKETKESELVSYFNNIPDEYYHIRKNLIDLLKDYIVEYSFNTRSYFLGIYFLDYIYTRYSYKEITSNFKTDLLVLGVFLNAIKFIDDDAYPPGLDSFPSKKNPSILYTMNEVRRYEFLVAKLVNYKMDIFTSYYLTETILSFGIVFTYEIEKMGINTSKVVKDTIKKLYRLALDINKMFIEDINSIKFNALEIASTCIMMAKELLNFEDHWNKELQYLYRIESENLNVCYNSILKAYENSQYHSGTSTSTSNTNRLNKKEDQIESISTTSSSSKQLQQPRAVNRSASSAVVNQSLKSVSVSVSSTATATASIDNQNNKQNKKLKFNVEPIDENDELKKKIPEKMEDNLLKNKTVSLENKDLLKENIKQSGKSNINSRFSTKDVVKVKEALNTKK